MFNQAVRATEAGCASKDPDIRADLHRAFASATHLHGKHAAKSDHLTGRNLMTWTKYDGLDPENTGAYGSQGNDLSRSRTGAFSGIDYFGTPNLRSYQFSLNVGF